MPDTCMQQNQSLKRDLWKVEGCVRANEAAAPNCSFPTLQGMDVSTLSTSPPRRRRLGPPSRFWGDSHAFATGCRQEVPGGHGKADLQLSPTACHAARVVVQEDTTASAGYGIFLMLLNVSVRIQGQKDLIAFGDTRHSRRQAFLGRPKPGHRVV